MKTIVTILLTFFVSFTFSQSYDWTLTGGDTGWDEVMSTAVDNAGNVYTLGSFEGTVDFDPGSFTLNLTSEGDWDAFLAKYDPSGNLLWAHRFGGADRDAGKFVKCDENGGVYIAGNYAGTVDFDPTSNNQSLTSTNGNMESFVAKFDGSGSLTWVKGIAGNCEIFSMDTDTDGNLYGTGSFRNTVDFDPGSNAYNISSNNTNNIFTFKWDANGGFIWAHGFTSDAYDRGQSIHVDGNNDIYLTGYYQETVDFDPGSGTSNQTSNGGADIFVLKLDASGGFQWVNSIGGIEYDYGNSIMTTSSGVYLTGYYQETVDFNSGSGTDEITAFGEEDIFVLHLNHSGDFQWVNNYGGLYSDYGNTIVRDNNNSIYFAGSFSGSAEFDPGNGSMILNSEGGHDIFVSKIDDQGETDWTIQMGGPGDERANTIAVSDAFSIYTAGPFQQSTDFDPGASTDVFTSAGDRDFFLHKYAYPLSIYSEDNLDDDFLVYPNPSEGGHIHISGEAVKKYKNYELRNAQGILISKGVLKTSDSIIKLDPHASGVYYVTFTNKSFRVTKKVLIK